jgi:hypothetical protein
MLKIIILIVVGFVIYKIFFDKKIENNSTTSTDDSDELVECFSCHTFVQKSECKWTKNGWLCKDCQ